MPEYTSVPMYISRGRRSGSPRRLTASLLAEERILEQVPRPWLRLGVRVDVDPDARHLTARVRRPHRPVREPRAVRVEVLDEVLEVPLHRLRDLPVLVAP